MASTGEGRRLGAFTSGAYENRSVLDNIQPSGIGYSAADKARLTPDGKAVLPSLNGRSAQTHQKRIWLDSPLRTFT